MENIEQNKIEETKKEELLSEVLNKENEEVETNEPKIIKGEKHSKLMYFILFILLLIIGCVVTIFVLDGLSK